MTPPLSPENEKKRQLVDLASEIQIALINGFDGHGTVMFMRVSQTQWRITVLNIDNPGQHTYTLTLTQDS